MTEPTIKEKMAKIIRERTSELSKPFYSDDDLAQILTKIQNAILKDFARLICEEMTGKMIIPAETFGDQGYNIRVAENEVKAQEIFKALE